MNTEPIICIELSLEQLARLSPVLDGARACNHYEGLFASVTRVYSPAAGRTVLELQVIEVPRSKITKLLRLLESRNQLVSERGGE